ncbi:MAG: precorrin-6Y C5,15-methyltransferase (decarboxylating) subunit CbiT [Gammaproteobacteria bacterium]|nr:MAG: precorrin-6Y C5,15-methyltransferase (decarboxylating) subunit CbiT [Pseudomonadota bacterium]PIE38049.1 MAG: precorrin-6Y C5,15-methyltransferase (decarboxylating) subunit CbiT [Gammaproteobacteria bacterium]
MPLHVIGLGVAEKANLDTAALTALQSADCIIGAERQLETVRSYISADQRTELLPKLPALKKRLAASFEQDESVALLASGDPLFFGIGKWVQKHFHDKSRFPGEGQFSCEDQFSRRGQQGQVHFYAGISSIQVACHRLAWSIQDVEVVSLHGRPLADLSVALLPNKKYVLLTDERNSPRSIARECFHRGYESAVLTVCEKLGYADEKISRLAPAGLLQGAARNQHFDALNVVCLQTLESSRYIPLFPGIPDPQFVTDKAAGKGMITKREVRLAILSLLEPSPGDCFWDIGAGCGGVATELALWGKGAQVYAIEHHQERLACLRENRQRFGVSGNLHIVDGRAPQICSDLPGANKVFIGGSGGQLPEILAFAWQNLPPGGTIVASAVTEQTRQHLYRFYTLRLRESASRVDTVEIAVNRGEILAGDLYYQPQLPVTLYQYVK